MRKSIVLALVAFCLTACQESLEEKAAMEAKMYTMKQCPAQMGENLVIDSMTFQPSTHTFCYYYTLKGALDSVGVLNKENIREVMVRELRNTTSMMAYKEAGYKFKYTYRSQKNPKNVLLEMLFTKKDYDKQQVPNSKP